MTDRTLVVYERDKFSPGGGRLFALPPGQAPGIGLPAFRFGAGTPATGDVEGDAFYDTISKTAFVWSGTKWLPIAPTAIVTYPDEATMLADKAQPPGSYGASAATGTLYIMTATGWRASGVRAYPTQAALLADPAADATLGITVDGGLVYARNRGAWVPLGITYYATMAELLAATSGDGTTAVALDRGQTFIRTSGAWKAGTAWAAKEAEILADTAALDGSLAVATDTGHAFVRAGGAWVGSPIAHYPTEAALLAATAPAGTLAWGDDTQVPYTRTATGWKALTGGVKITVGTAAPATATDGDLWLDTGSESDTRGLNVRSGTDWRSFGAWSLNENGGLLPAPGHLNADPSSTIKPTGMVGIAFSYSGDGKLVRPFSKRRGANYIPLTPPLGDTQHAGKMIVADDNAHPVWGDRPVKRIATVEFKGTGPGGRMGSGWEKFTRVEADVLWIPRTGDDTMFLVFEDANGEMGASGASSYIAWGIEDWGTGGSKFANVKNGFGGSGDQYIGMGEWKKDTLVRVRISVLNPPSEWGSIVIEATGVAKSGDMSKRTHHINHQATIPLTGGRFSGYTGQVNDGHGVVYGYP